MIRTISKITLIALSVTLINGCSSKEAKPAKEVSFECKQENVPAPSWTCIPEEEGYYAAVGVAEKSAAGIAHMRRVALMNGRSELAQEIQTDIKDKMEGFTRATGNGSSETVDKVTTAVTKQVAKVTLQGSMAKKMWQVPSSGTLYLLVVVPKENVNKAVKEMIKNPPSSFNNDNALWQQFQSKQALESLEKEFPTK